jgi:hypothetical protein
MYSQEAEGISPSHSVVIMSDNMDANGYIKEYVENKIAKWQKKGEFEKTEDYKKRVTEEKRRAKADEYASEALDHLEEIFAKRINWNRFTLGKYDADNESFLLTHPELGKITLSVPIDYAPAFKKHFSKLNFSSPDFVYANNQFNLSELTIKDPVNGKSFQYDNEQSAAYVSQNIDYNFADLEVNVSTEEETYTDKTKISENNLRVGSDPVDTDIPAGNITRDKTFALIIGNEDYSVEQKVPYAQNDARVFKKYCNKTLGLPEDNIHLLTNATLGQMLGEVNWLAEIAKAYKGEAALIFYYAGHGMPSEETKDAYLLPIDGSSEMVQTSLKLEDLYKQLNQYPAKQVTVFMDACFSGASRNGMLAAGRGVKIEPKKNALKGNMVVLSAASGKQTAYPYTDKGHGLFTYYLLKKLQETKGNTDLGELSNYLKERVEQKSVVKNSKPQNPKVNVSNKIQHNWKNLKIAY